MATGDLFRKILGKILPRNPEYGEPTGPGTEEAPKEWPGPKRGTPKKSAKATPKGKGAQPEETLRKPEEKWLPEETSKQAPSAGQFPQTGQGQTGQAEQEEQIPSRGKGEKVPTEEHAAMGKSISGKEIGKIPGEKMGRLEAFPQGPHGESLYEWMEKEKGRAWRDKGTKAVKEYVKSLVGKTISVGGTAVLISGLALASLIGLGTLTNLGDKLQNAGSPPDIIATERGTGSIPGTKTRQCMFATRDGKYVTVTGQPLTISQMNSRCSIPFGSPLPTFVNNKPFGICTKSIYDCN